MCLPCSVTAPSTHIEQVNGRRGLCCRPAPRQPPAAGDDPELESPTGCIEYADRLTLPGGDSERDADGAGDRPQGDDGKVGHDTGQQHPPPGADDDEHGPGQLGCCGTGEESAVEEGLGQVRRDDDRVEDRGADRQRSRDECGGRHDDVVLPAHPRAQLGPGGPKGQQQHRADQRAQVRGMLRDRSRGAAHAIERTVLRAARQVSKPSTSMGRARW
jgi:hypothetical protein